MGDSVSMAQSVTLAIVVLTYTGIAVGHIPGLRMNRATITLAASAALIAVGTLSEQQAIASLDVGTLLLLGSMMIINANLRLAGFFELVGYHVLRIAHTPRALLALVILAAGTLSALFLNDTICVLFTPLVVELLVRLKRDPIPYLIGLATATNVGSTATITGNPQNLIIGHTSGIPYLTFLIHLAPVALSGMVVCWVVIVLVFSKEFTGQLDPIVMDTPRTYSPLLWRVGGVVIGLMVAFLVGLPIVSSACVAAGLLLVSRLRPDKLLSIDWSLLAFFGGLFVVTGAIETSGLSSDLFSLIAPVIEGGIVPLSAASLGLSNLISNVPTVLLLRSQIAALPDPQNAWLTLAMSSTLAGNLTLLGSAANLIVAEIAARHGIKLSFMTYLKAGIPITLLTTTIGIAWLSLI
jgi:Na+/H+ antiporter NhaD/arsenite permease-like protein